MIMAMGRGCEVCRISHWPVSQAFVIVPKRRVAAAAAWVRKYLVAASTARG